MLRHVISHLRRQDWTAVFVELFVIVVGVFIGVQAANWNDTRQRDAKAAVFTERLRSDLREEAWGYEYEVGYFKGVLVSAKRAADALSGKIPLSYEALLVASYRATQYRFNIRRRATYDDLDGRNWFDPQPDIARSGDASLNRPDVRLHPRRRRRQSVSQSFPHGDSV